MNTTSVTYIAINRTCRRPVAIWNCGSYACSSPRWAYCAGICSGPQSGTRHADSNGTPYCWPCNNRSRSRCPAASAASALHGWHVHVGTGNWCPGNIPSWSSCEQFKDPTSNTKTNSHNDNCASTSNTPNTHPKPTNQPPTILTLHKICAIVAGYPLWPPPF